MIGPHSYSSCGLSTAERTGSPVFHTLWSYVLELSLHRVITSLLVHGCSWLLFWFSKVDSMSDFGMSDTENKMYNMFQKSTIFKIPMHFERIQKSIDRRILMTSRYNNRASISPWLHPDFSFRSPVPFDGNLPLFDDKYEGQLRIKPGCSVLAPVSEPSPSLR